MNINAVPADIKPKLKGLLARPPINGIAVARGATRIADVADASAYDFTSRTRRPQLGEVALLRNVRGFYAAVQILSIKDDTRGADRDEIRIRFAVQPDGSPSFSGEQIQFSATGSYR
jgi:hypothetical protein